MLSSNYRRLTTKLIEILLLKVSTAFKRTKPAVVVGCSRLLAVVLQLRTSFGRRERDSFAGNCDVIKSLEKLQLKIPDQLRFQFYLL